MKRALITGAAGFVAKHLIKELEDNGYEVIKTDRMGSGDMVKMNILDQEEVLSVLNIYKPSAIFHLAAFAFVPTSFKVPGMVDAVNHGGTRHILEAVGALGIDCTVQVACSSEEYGLVLENEVPIKETNPLRPLSQYAVSKVAADFTCYQYFRSYGIKTIRTRAFNHTGPGRGEQYMTSTFAKQIAEIEAGFNPNKIIQVGDLTSIRDFTDVRDTVRAYRLLVEKGEPGEVYNIATGEGHTAQEVLDTLISLANPEAMKDLQIVQDPARMRPSDVKILIGDCSRLKAATGWEPSYKFKQTMSDLLDYWREKINENVQDKTAIC